MSQIFYLANEQLHSFNNHKSMTISCDSVEKYKRNLQEIQQRKQWKTTGTGAQFMGAYAENQDVNLSGIYPTSMVQIDENHFIYTAQLQEGSSICLKNFENWQEDERLVLRKSDLTIQGVDYDASKRRLILSARSSCDYEQHLCIFSLDGNSMQFVTEGRCHDANPCFNPLNNNQIFYDTCGISYDYGMDIGPKEICKLDLSTGDLETILGDEKFDFVQPQIDKSGNLYCIQRPYGQASKGSVFLSLKNLVLAPVKIIKAIIGWLDFFTQKYTGESLKTTSGSNPAKTKQKSKEELFIEGNLIKARQTLENNQKAGEKYPGVIPRSWQLIKITPSGEKEILKKGVMGFLIQEDAIIYSNGKHLVQLASDRKEVLLLEEQLVSKIAQFKK